MSDQTIEALRAENERLRAEAAKIERLSITLSDIMHNQVLAMRAAVVAAHLESPEHGMQWIVNTLDGPGHLPDLGEACMLGGAQALFDKESAEHEAFRAARPGPAPLSEKDIAKAVYAAAEKVGPLSVAMTFTAAAERTDTAGSGSVPHGEVG